MQDSSAWLRIDEGASTLALSGARLQCDIGDISTDGVCVSRQECTGSAPAHGFKEENLNTEGAVQGVKADVCLAGRLCGGYTGVPADVLCE